MVERVFFNVGQALFCLECCGREIVIYDCGGQNAPIVKKAIDRAEIVGCNIKALFISHYDRDHINGVSYLLNKCKVEHLFLPMVREQDKLVTLLDYRKGSAEYTLALDCQQFIQGCDGGRETKIHFVKAQEDENFRGDKSRDSNRYDGNNRVGIPIDSLEKELDSGTPISIPSRAVGWVYIPFNLKYMDSTQWSNFVTGLGLSPNATCATVLNAWKKTKLALKQKLIAADAVSVSDINTYSMTLYSGFIHSDEYHRGCLYTGDYDANANFNQLHKVYSDVWQNIGIVQVPHHGSINNWNNKLIITNAIYIVPGVRKNTHMRNWIDPQRVIFEIGKCENVLCTDNDDIAIALHDHLVYVWHHWWRYPLWWHRQLLFP